MAIGDVAPVSGADDVHYVDTGMYDVAEYGSVYVVDAERPAVVDTGIGADYEAVAAALDELGIGADDLAWILPTHVHLDHAGGAGFLARDHPEAEVRVHERGVRHLVDPSRLVEGTKSAVGDQWRFYAEPEPVPEDRIAGLADGDEIDLGDHRLVAREAPGHAPHQHVFHDVTEDVVFTGDAAGLYVRETDTVRETTPPPQFDLDQARRDAQLLAELEPETLAFGHFGPRDFDADLLSAYERTLVEWVEAVRAKREELGDDEAVVDHFVAHADELAGADVWGQRKAEDEAELNTRGVLASLRRGEE